MTLYQEIEARFIQLDGKLTPEGDKLLETLNEVFKTGGYPHVSFKKGLERVNVTFGHMPLLHIYTPEI